MKTADAQIRCTFALQGKISRAVTFRNITTFGEECNKAPFSIEIFFFVLSLISLGAKVSAIRSVL